MFSSFVDEYLTRMSANKDYLTKQLKGLLPQEQR